MDATRALGQYIASRPSELVAYGDEYSLVYSGVDFHDGDSIALHVTRLAHDHYLISDAGLAADRLGDAGVDLSMHAAGESWRLVTQSDAPVLAEVGDFEIARTATAETLGETMWEVAVRCLQADGLRAIGKNQRRASFMDQAMRAASEAGFLVRPKAALRNKFGGERRVHFELQADPGGRALMPPKHSAPAPYFVMTANAEGSFTESHDSVLNAFRGAEVEQQQRIALLGPRAHPLPWHEQSLAEVCRVRRTTEVEDFAFALVD